MNFLCVGSALLLFQLNIGWASNYIVKAVGCLLFSVGAKELLDLMGHMGKIYSENIDKSALENDFAKLNKLYRHCLMSAGLCALSAVCVKLMQVINPVDFAMNVIYILLGGATIFISFNLFRMAYVFLTENDKLAMRELRLTNDKSNLRRLGGSFSKLFICVALNFGLDILNRFVKIDFISSMAGVGVAISKILLYIFLAVLVYNFNKVRIDCNNKFENV